MEGHPARPVPAGAGAGPGGPGTTVGDVATPFRLPPDRKRALQALAGVGILTLVVGLLVTPARTGANVLLVGFYLLTLGLGGVFFVALSYTADATWSVGLRRVPEALAGLVPGAALLLAALLFVHPSLYPWASGDETLTGFRGFWLVRPFFLARAVVYLLGWMWLAAAIVRNSRRQDHDGLPSRSTTNLRLSGIFLVVFSVTFWLASVDWVMSLEPHWFSTIFGLYNFAGLFLGGLAAITLLTVWLQRRSTLGRIVTASHLHDLGKLLFAFSTFWMYIWFCQYMLIWYVNIPEETAYFTTRAVNGWQWVMLVNIFLNWVIPFVVLLPRAAKRRADVLVKIAVVLLVGRWVDLYVMILPPVSESTVPLGPVEIGLAVGGVGVCGLLVARSLAKAELVPVGDPFLEESVRHRT